MLPIRDANPSSRFPIVTVSLIAINVLMSIYWLLLVPMSAYEAALFRIAFIPGEFVRNPLGIAVIGDLFRSMFLHGDLLHLGGNMLYLWLFGDNVEDIMGPVKYIIFYFVAGVAASLAQVAIGPNSTIPLIGASGAISGVLGAYLVRFPNARVLTVLTLGYFIRLQEVRAIWVLGFWFVLQLVLGLLSVGVQSGGVAYFAHIGGFVAGVVMVWIFAPGGARQRAF